VCKTLEIATEGNNEIIPIPELTCNVGDGNPVDLMFNELAYSPLSKYFEHPLGKQLKEWARTALRAITDETEKRNPNVKSLDILIGGHAVLQNAIGWAIFDEVYEASNVDHQMHQNKTVELIMQVNLKEASAFKLTLSLPGSNVPVSCEYIQNS